MKINKIAIADLDGYWITPNGQLIEVGFAEHGTYVSNNHLEFNIPRKEMLSILSKNCNGPIEALVAQAIKNGAIHISVYTGSMKIQAKSPQLVLQYKDLINQVAKNSYMIPKWGSNEYSNILVDTTSYLKYLCHENI